MAKQYYLGKYQLIKRIAIGGMSEIYLASQGGLDGFERAVIVKVIREDLDTENEVKEMFLDEARIAACLKHPNIVHLYDVGRDQGNAYLAMEYIFGRDLMAISERVRTIGQQLPIQFIIKVMCDALAGLNYAHQVAEFEDKPLNVIHRDVSPQNILVSFDGITKVLDFGIAKATARLSETRVGILKGKYAYMSPEQVRGKKLDHRSDQFSLAVVFYEIITGTRLFQRETDYSTMEAVDLCEVPPIRILRKDVPRRLMRVLRKAMRRKPKRRFSSSKEMERALHRLLKGSGVEQNERVSAYMRKLFADELKARDQAISDASAEEKELLIKTGFEMVDEKDTQIGNIPEPPLARKIYGEILAQREAVKTKVRSKPTDVRKQTDLSEVQTDPQGGADQETTMLDKKSGKLLEDWRFLVLVFLGVAVIALFIMTTFGEDKVTPPPTKPSLGTPQKMKTTARPGLDGFLSVSVGHTVRVKVDGKDLGLGAFRMHPLERGPHKIVLTTSRGESRTWTVQIKPDKEYILGPADYQ
jgi:serine/threonine protein kinase